MNSKDKLAAALTATGDDQLTGLIERARAGYYSDYESPLVDPIVQLVKDLRDAGHPGLARRAIDGEFDGTLEEAETWAASPEGQEMIQQFFGGR